MDAETVRQIVREEIAAWNKARSEEAIEALIAHAKETLNLD